MQEMILILRIKTNCRICLLIEECSCLLYFKTAREILEKEGWGVVKTLRMHKVISRP